MRIVIDGNIGSGKSTQITLLEKFGFKCNKEPIHTWPLDLFYKDPPRWAFLLQMKILESYTDPDDDRIYERCLQSSNDVFWKHLVTTGVVTSEEDRVYKDWFRNVEWFPDVNIYLSSQPEKCLGRIQQRTQAGDSAVSLDYLEKIHTLYELVWFRARKEQKTRHFHIIYVEDKTPEDIHKEILSVLELEDAMFLVNNDGSKVQEAGASRRKVLCASPADLCHMS